MGGEGEETEAHPEEAEPKVADATKYESDEWPSDPGSDASDGDRDRRPGAHNNDGGCLLYTSPSPRDLSTSRMPSSA